MGECVQQARLQSNGCGLKTNRTFGLAEAAELRDLLTSWGRGFLQGLRPCPRGKGYLSVMTRVTIVRTEFKIFLPRRFFGMTSMNRALLFPRA